MKWESIDRAKPRNVYIHLMKLIILGSGTSHGVPVIGCPCRVCRSVDIRNKRTRSSAWLQFDDLSIVIDTSTDFRAQALREGMNRLDAVLYTHSHADHLLGLDDTRSLSRDKPVSLYATEETAQDIRNRFAYVFGDGPVGGGKPRVRLTTITTDDSFKLGSVSIVPVPVYHGDLPICGYRIGSLAYITDCSRIEDHVFERLEGVRVLVIGALREEPHPTHFTVAEAIDTSRRIGASETYLTHMCHELEHDELGRRLPEGIWPAYDGVEIRV